MLRAGAAGVQRVLPTSARTAGSSGVLSFKAVQKAKVAAEGPEASWEGDEAEDFGDPSASGVSWMYHDDDAGQEIETSASAPQAPALQPRAKPMVARPPQAPPSRAKQAMEEDESVLETDDWVKDFEKKWADAMGKTDTAPSSTVDAADSRRAPTTPPNKKARTMAEPRRPVSPKRGAPPQPKTAPKLAAAPFAPRPPLCPPGGKAPPAAKGAAGVPRPPPGPAPPRSAAPVKGAPITPTPRTLRRVASSEVEVQDHPDWAARCTIDAMKPGQAQRIAIAMAEVGLDDGKIVEWCDWMDKRLTRENPTGYAGGRARFRANMIDFSENKLGANGVKALCSLLEKHGVRCDVLRLTGNLIGNEGVRCIAKYLMITSQAPTGELHLSRNKLNGEGLKWLLGCLAMHPAYPVWNMETERFVPLRLHVVNPKLKGEAGYKALGAACSALTCSVCMGDQNPRQYVNASCCDEFKHNCVAHLVGWEVLEDALPLPTPEIHARMCFGPAGRSAVKAAPSGVDKPVREEPRVVFEDDDLAVVFKPASWSCASNAKGVDAGWAKLKPLMRRRHVGELLVQESSPPLQAWLLLHFGADPTCDASRDQASDRGIVHRLDVDTSGPLLIGKTLKGYEHARRQIVLGILKDYLALVHGSFSTDRGECNAPIDATAYKEMQRVVVGSSGQPATTVWEALAEYESPDREEKFTLLHCRMVTLRTHQLRAHLEHLGHPVAGDTVYGSASDSVTFPRLFLHKLRIGFFNIQGQACIETCSLQSAPDLWKALSGLRKLGDMSAKGCGAPGSY